MSLITDLKTIIKNSDIFFTGGQLNLLGARPFLAMAVRDTKLVEGLYPYPDASSSRSIFTTRGVGNLMGNRFNCRPEVSMLSSFSTG